MGGGRVSKTSPVRWWRDDADRYRPRGAVGPMDTPHLKQATGLGGWVLHLRIRDLESDLGAQIEGFRDIICSRFPVPVPEWRAPPDVNPFRDAMDGLEIQARYALVDWIAWRRIVFAVD